MSHTQKAVEVTTDPLERLRKACLSRGARGIKGLGRTFRIYDDDGSKTLNIEEFTKGLHDYGVELSKKEAQQLFNRFDTDNSGHLDFDEFLKALRPLNSKREFIIDKVFDKFDKTGDGELTIADIKGNYNYKNHPKYRSGDWSEQKVFQEFLNQYEGPGSGKGDGKVTREEFKNYYAGVSASIDHDAYFDLMMRQAWKHME